MPRVKYLKKEYRGLVSDCPSFHKSGSVCGMKEQFYGKSALLVRCGNLQKRSNAFSEIRHKTIVTDDAYILGLKKSRTIMHSYNVNNKLKEKFERYLV